MSYIIAWYLIFSAISAGQVPSNITGVQVGNAGHNYTTAGQLPTYDNIQTRVKPARRVTKYSAK